MADLVRFDGERALSIDLKRWEKSLQTKVMPEIVDSIATKIEKVVVDNLSGKILNKGSGGRGRRGGRLSQSIFIKKKGGKSKPQRTIGSKLIYAAVHEFGATIRAKGSGFLRFRIHTSNRIFSKSGKRLKRAIRGFTWVSVKQVKIPARQPFLKSFQQSIRFFDPIIKTVLDRHIT